MTPELFRKLSALGLTTDQMAGVLEIMEAEAEVRKAKGRERVQKWREKKACNVTQRHVTAENVSNALVRAEDSSSTKQITRKEEDTSPSVRSSRGTRIPDDFAPDIDAAISDGLSRQEAERQAASFVDYWKAKPGKDAMKLDWPATWRIWFRRRLDDDREQSTAPPRKQTVGQQARDELKRMGLFDDTTSTQTGHIDQGDGSPGFAGTGIARRIAIASSR